MTNKERHELDEEIIKLRKSGKTIKEISEIVNRSEYIVRKKCREQGLDGMLYHAKPSQSFLDGLRKAREESTQKTIGRLSQECKKAGFEYLGGYTGTECKIRIKCLKCGYEFLRGWQNIRRANFTGTTIRCGGCVLNRQEERKAQAKEKQAQIIEDKKAEKEKSFWKQTFNQREFSFCENCNSIVFTGNKFCSAECYTSFYNKQKKDRRLRKIRGVKVSYIDIKRLYARDKGFCWLCGKQCDFKDYRTTDKGVFIAGNNYPSIDHVTPLSKGGLHSWDNVKLACRGCNSKRGNRVSTLPISQNCG